MNLREMALQKRLPIHQFMDRSTLNWIKDTAVLKGLAVHDQIILPDALVDKLHFSQPAQLFFVDKEIYEGLHGFRHCNRVALLAGAVAIEAGIADASTMKVVMIAGSLHDCRRINDNADTGHGSRSADWFRANVGAVCEHYNVNFSQIEIELIDKAIRFHDTGQVEATFADKRYLQVIETVKTADALDRYRQPKDKWWIDDSYLEIKPSLSLKNSAFNLMYHFEDAYLQTNNNEQAFGLIRKRFNHA